MTTNEWDAFISHASEDNALVARPLADKLAAAGLRVWLDEAELLIGDSLRAKVDEGLLHSQYGIVILSPDFFAKRWPRSELDGLVAREADALHVVLPVWHGVCVDDVLQFSPILAGRFSVSTDLGLDEVAKKIVAAIYATGRRRTTGHPIYRGKLLKSILMDLPTGSVLMSNLINPIDHTPLHIEEIGIPAMREELWDRLRAAGVTGRTIYVFADTANMREHLGQRLRWDPEL